MTEIYIPLADFANPPTRKGFRELVATFPQIVGYTRHSGEFVLSGVKVAAGVVLETNQDPEPDEAAIVAAAVALDGTEDPSQFGIAFPLVSTAADLPAQPPNLPNNRALLAAVANPPGLYAYARGAWRGPL